MGSGKKKEVSSPNFTSNLTSNVPVQSIQKNVLADGANPNLNLFGLKLVSVGPCRAFKLLTTRSKGNALKSHPSFKTPPTHLYPLSQILHLHLTKSLHRIKLRSIIRDNRNTTIMKPYFVKSRKSQETGIFQSSCVLRISNGITFHLRWESWSFRKQTVPWSRLYFSQNLSCISVKATWNPVFLPRIHSKEQDRISNKKFYLSPVEGNGSSNLNLYIKAHFIVYSCFSLYSWINAWTIDYIQENLSTRILYETQREAKVFQ